MPTINVKKELLMQRLGQQYSDEEFDKLCFEFGLELDEITSEKKMALKEKGTSGEESDDVIYKIDIPANRYDLLSLEGLVLALKIFTCKIKAPKFKTTKGNLKFYVDQHANAVRPVLVAAIVRNIKFNQDIYNSFIDLQDKLHQNIGRKRTIVSIGTHDLDTINGPFLYTAMKPNELKFKPLNQDKEFTACELMEFYAESHLKTYLPIIKDKPEYPVIMDKDKKVLSMPPIINGEISKITLNTKNILIEVTATNKEKAEIALDTVLAMLVSTNNSFEAESVEIEYFDGTKYVSPNFQSYDVAVDKQYLNQGLGINYTDEQLSKLLNRMGLETGGPKESDKCFGIWIPPTRHDIIHCCDILEDVAIAYGYDNIEKRLPKCVTIPSQVMLNKLTDQLRHEVARCGYTEALNFALCSEAELSTMLRKKNVQNLVRIQNPKTIEFQVARTVLLPGLLKTLNSNKKMALPMKLFEISDVVLADSAYDVGAKNERHLGAIYYGKQTSGFEIIHGLLDRVMEVMETPYVGDRPDKKTIKHGYYIEATEDEAYLTGRCASIIYNGEKIGQLGILHPEVLLNYDLNHPSSVLEMNLEMFHSVRGG